jgi:hypothetical protein
MASRLGIYAEKSIFELAAPALHFAGPGGVRHPKEDE